MDMTEQPFDPRDYEAFVREIDAGQYNARLQNLPRGVIPKRRGMSMAQSIAAEGTLFQSGIAFWLPPGDGGTNGLSFTGTRGVFTLSAESPLSGAFNMLVAGGYIYLPAGAGGLATGGWFWCKMTDGTNGEVFAETYSGRGEPAFVSSPTALSNLTSGRITQITTEINGPSFTLPGGCLGPNGIFVAKIKYVVPNSAGLKTVRLRAATSDLWISLPATTNYLNQLIINSRINGGTQLRQIGNRPTTGGWDSGGGLTAYSGDVTTTNTSVDQPMTLTGQVATNTDSIFMFLIHCTAQYGA